MATIMQQENYAAVRQMHSLPTHTFMKNHKKLLWSWGEFDILVDNCLWSQSGSAKPETSAVAEVSKLEEGDELWLT